MKYNKLFLITIVFILVSCNKKGSDTDTFGKKEMFTNYTENLIIPAYQNYGTKLSDLKTTFDAFKIAPDLTKLATLQNAFSATYEAWQYCEICKFFINDISVFSH
ncbi:MAG: imelysin family protein [Chitinophagales bacterium]